MALIWTVPKKWMRHIENCLSWLRVGQETLRLAYKLLQDIITAMAQNGLSGSESCDSVDFFFCNELARRAYDMLQMLKSQHYHESSCIRLVWLDATITEIVDSFQPAAVSGVSSSITLLNKDSISGANNYPPSSLKILSTLVEKVAVCHGTLPDAIALYFLLQQVSFQIEPIAFWLMSKSNAGASEILSLCSGSRNVASIQFQPLL